MPIRPDGPTDARIMIVGEAPGEEEDRRGTPFCGASGLELNRMLHEAGIARSQCFVTNVVRERPPGNDLTAWLPLRKSDITSDMVEHYGRKMKPNVLAGIQLLQKEVERVNPNVIIAVGNVAMWALTGRWGIDSWRGSSLPCLFGRAEEAPPTVVPTYSPAYILRVWADRQYCIADLRRAKRFELDRTIRKPAYNFTIRPSFTGAIDCLEALIAKVSDTVGFKVAVDIETRAGHIACIGLAWSVRDALCLPLMCTERESGYWSLEEEAEIVWRLYKLLTHPNIRVIGQNFAYDIQYIWRYWHFLPRVTDDTMLAHHTCWPGTPKGLDFLSSLYCDYHEYWKDEGKEWRTNMGEDQLWAYNCKDGVITFECMDRLNEQIDKLGLREPYEFQMKLFWPVTHAMRRGIRRDDKTTAKFAMELSEEMAAREQWFLDVCGHPLNVRSPKQMQAFFYSDLGQRVIYSRKGKTKGPTLDDEALVTIAKREPLLRPLVRRIQEVRSINVFLKMFVMAKPSWDGRLRSSFNIAGTETFRLSSSTDAFDSGMNLQNIPKGGSVDKDDVEALVLPNVRKLFLPDPGYTIWDMDLDRADLQVVVWEADDAGLKQMLRAGVDLHSENANTLGVSRQLAKAWVHGTNYGGGPRTMAVACGISVHQAEKMRNRWFQAHPGIHDWHRRVEAGLKAHRSVANKFGYRRFYFDRIEGLLPEALAWIPQSTVACVINRAWLNIYNHSRHSEVLIQVHDSLVGQFPTEHHHAAIAELKELARITVPYDDPLVIPVGVKVSTYSWGECQ